MSSRVRILPVLIGTASVLMALRIGAMASSAEPPKAAETPKAAAAEAPPEAPDHGTAAEVPADLPATPSAPAPSGVDQAQTKGEAEVLQKLGERRATLEERERDLAMREQLVSVTEKQVEAKLIELKGLEERLGAMLAKRDEAEEVQLASLVKTYENMKAPDAARIFNKLDRQVLLNVASRMKPAKIGAVMAAMDASRAQDLTVMLAMRHHVAKPLPAAAPAPAAQAEPATAPAPQASNGEPPPEQPPHG